MNLGLKRAQRYWSCARRYRGDVAEVKGLLGPTQGFGGQLFRRSGSQRGHSVCRSLVQGKSKTGNCRPGLVSNPHVKHAGGGLPVSVPMSHRVVRLPRSSANPSPSVNVPRIENDARSAVKLPVREAKRAHQQRVAFGTAIVRPDVSLTVMDKRSSATVGPRQSK